MLRIHDTLTRQVSEVAPARGLRMYVCAHRPAHLGELRPLLMSDLIRRVLERHRVRTVVCQGVDDAGPPPFDALNLRSPEQSPRAADHVSQVIELIATLIERGHGSVADGQVLFDPSGVPAYGELSDESPAGWALWRPADDEPAWDSPWGRGRPSPDVTCAALSLRMGAQVDIQAGSAELIFPHHERVRAATGGALVRRWVHAERLSFDGGGLADVTAAGLDPLAVRLALLEHHYRSPLDLTWDALRAADHTLRRWRSLVAEWSESPSAPMAAAHVRRAESALDDDLDTPAVLRVLNELERDDSVPPGAKFESFLHLDHILALDLPSDIGKPRP